MSVALPHPVAVRPIRAPWVRIARYAVRRRRTAVLAWGVPLGALAAMVVAIFPSISGAAGLEELLQRYPAALKEAFGISDASFSTAEGYLAGELFNLIAPFACCYFVLHGLAVALASAEQRGTVDVVLSAPIARRQYIAGWLAGLSLTLLGILAVLALMMQAAAVALGVDLALSSTLAGVLNLWPIAIFAGGLTVVLCALLPGSAGVTGAAAGVFVAAYFVEVLGRLSDTVARVDVLSAFHFYGSAIEDGLDPAAFFGLIAAGLVLAGIGCVLFERRDLRR